MDNVEVEKKAKEILADTFENVDDLTLPIQIGTIAAKNNISVKQGDFEHPDVSGSYDRASKTIIVDVDDDPKRQVFTVAHELGHYFLHTNKEKEVYFRYYSERLNLEEKKDEAQANLFAASLLMPENIVKREWEEHGDERLLAVKFGVSQPAMHYRLKNLRLLD